MIPPGATIGVLGGGQLGRMFAIAARRLGYRVHTLAPEDDTPTGQIADVEINAEYDDLDAVRAFARGVDVVTFEFENVPAAATAAAEEFAIVRPSGHALFVTQHRIREKTLSRGAGAAGHAVRAGSIRKTSCAAAIAQVGCPAVLKTASFGYDGKGQVPVAQAADALPAWHTLGRQEAVLEAFIDLDREISVVAARGVDGDRIALRADRERAPPSHPRRLGGAGERAARDGTGSGRGDAIDARGARLHRACCASNFSSRATAGC